jgi:hypothetical protein
MPDYKLHDPKGWCGDPRRGAAMGRPSVRGPRNFAGRIYLRRVRLDSGGYDSNGTYFGHRDGLIYWYANEDGTIDGTLDAKNRKSAHWQVTVLYPNAKVRK